MRQHAITYAIAEIWKKMKISAATCYALQSLIQLARSDQPGPISASRLARGDIPRRFLGQVLHKLVENQVLISAAGVAGGYYLARPPRNITLLEIIEAVDGTFSITMACIPTLSPAAQNELMSKFAAASELVRDRFRSITLAQLASAAPDKTDELGQNSNWRYNAKSQNHISAIQLECQHETAGSSQ